MSASPQWALPSVERAVGGHLPAPHAPAALARPGRNAATWTGGMGTLALLLGAALIALSGVEGGVEYQRARFFAEPWRALCAHFAHFSTSHLAWNALGFGVLGVLCERRDRRAFLSVLGLSVLAIPIGLYVLAPGFEVYRGLSGLTSALFGWVAVRLVREQLRDARRGAALLTGALALGFAAAMAHSWLHGAPLLVDGFGTEVVPVPLSHAIGFAIGAALALKKETQT